MGSVDLSWGRYLFVIGALVVVSALVWFSRYALMYLYSYSFKKDRVRNFSVEESITIDQKRRVVAVRYKEKVGLILVGGGNDLFLGWTETINEEGIE